ncbi:LysR family transcriptional regulator [Roseibium sediminicola]|uniref:LysR family transcriptional regulator n=1 Tax=Roseibium sediminicola TaxID=2933272 RepID=A0ABT0GY12_9HYPH|nr:LysR family transcriptional regulator [Roseibium sp. CAU 1639]MCK7614130.1 LysR family transcriptional regulator [Roseibium sp. CAU 1639]
MNDLDMDLLRAFVRVSETGSFTRAGQMLGASQSAVSVKIRKLEDRLGDALLARSPRSVQLTPFGARFLNDARELIDLHDRVAARVAGTEAARRYRLGISDHAAGDRLPRIIASLSDALPGSQWHVTVGLSDNLFRDYKAGLFNAVMVRSEDVEANGLTAFEEDLVWTASKDFVWETGAAFPLVALTGSCALRKLATATLKEAGIVHEDVFTGTGVSAVQAAVGAGLGIACLDRRNLPAGSRDVGETYRLPELPRTRMALFCREGEPVTSAILKAFRETG